MFEVLNVEVNVLALVLAVVVSMVWGMLWYGPLMGKKWMELVGMKKEDAEMKPMDLVFTLGMSLITAIGMNSVLQYAKDVSDLDMVVNVFLSSFMVAIAFVKPPLLNRVIWERGSKQLMRLNWVHQFLSLVLMSFVLSFFIY